MCREERGTLADCADGLSRSPLAAFADRATVSRYQQLCRDTEQLCREKRGTVADRRYLESSPSLRKMCCQGDTLFDRTDGLLHRLRGPAARANASRLAIRIGAVTDRRRAIASAVGPPCLRAFLFPLGATR